MVASPISAFAAPKGYLQLSSFAPAVKNARLTIGITTKTAIPTTGREQAFGYAVFTGGFSRVLVLVTHLGITDSKTVGLGGFHTHVLDLKNASAKCSGHAAEVDLASGKRPNFDPGYRFALTGNKATIIGVPTSAVKGARVEGVAAFTLTPVFQDENLTNLCVDVVNKLPK